MKKIFIIYILFLAGLFLSVSAQGMEFVGHIEYYSPDISRTGSPKPPESVPEGDFESLGYDQESYTVFEKLLHGVNVIVAIHEDAGWTPHEQESYANHVFNSWTLHWSVFQGFRFKEYRNIVKDDYIGSQGFGRIQDYPFHSAGLPGLKHEPHSIFHAWNGVGLSGLNPVERQRELWFIEGVTTYYDNRAGALFSNGSPRTLAEIETEFESDHMSGPGGTLWYYWEEIVGQDDDMAATEMGPAFDQGEKALHFYEKGALLAYMLDKRLNNHGSNLDILMRRLYKNFNHGKIQYRTEDILDICEDLTNNHCADIFEDYILEGGDKTLPLERNYSFAFFQNTLNGYFVSDLPLPSHKSDKLLPGVIMLLLDEE